MQRNQTKIFQLNLNRSPLALHNLMGQHQQQHCISLVQELPIRGNKIFSIPAPLQVIAIEESPRAAIIYNPSLDIWPIAQVSTRDCQAALWQTNGKNILLISAYWHAKSNELPNSLETIFTLARNKNYDIVLAIDTNGHHPSWGSEDENPRGRMAVSIFQHNNLIILNEGNAPTYTSGENSSHVDVTLVSSRLLNRVTSWINLPLDSFSDHACLQTIISNKETIKKSILDYSKTQWATFQSTLNGMDWSEYGLDTNQDINAAADVLTNTIQKAIKASTPMIKLTQKVKKAPWWSNDLKEMRRDLRVTFHNLRCNDTPLNRETYIAKRQSYQRHIKKAKMENWKNFVNECNTMADVSKLNRIITKKKAKPIGLTLTPNNTLTTTGYDSLKNLMSFHFPVSERSERHVNQNTANAPASGGNQTSTTWITLENTGKFINDLTLSKAPGPDGITNKIAKNLPENTQSFLNQIFQHCIKNEYVPEKWTKSRVVFIHKPNSKEQSHPKSYRPICLSNTFFKLLEQHIKSHLEDLQIYPHKLSNVQHGFRNDRSTYTALSTAINYIESAFIQKEIAIAVFLDIHGAFNNMIVQNALTELDILGAPTAITNTLRHYYKNRLVEGTINNATISINPERGTAQGNVLSPMLWNLVVDKIGHIIEQNEIQGTIFADDILLISKGRNHIEVTNKLQNALDQVRQWSMEQKLEINLQKTQTMCFTKNCNPPFKLFLGNNPISQTHCTKYLGLTVTENLDWTHHYKNVQKIAKTQLITAIKAIGKNWGPSPKLTHWLYKAVIRPKISYAAHIWAHAIPNAIMDRLSRQIQRWALIRLGPVREKSPIAGLEIITGTPPLKLYLKEMALKTYIRLKNIKFCLIPAHRGHLEFWNNIIRCNIPLNINDSDRTIKLKTPAFTNKVKSYDIAETFANIYTDGSAIGKPSEPQKDKKFHGSGFYLEWIQNGIPETRYGFLANGEQYSVFLSELRAIEAAAHFFLQEGVVAPGVEIFSDSKSAIQAIEKSHTSSKTVFRCWSKLSQLDQKYKWKLTWVKSHSGLAGNDIADSLAKRAAERSSQIPIPSPTIAPTQFDQYISQITMENWTRYWQNRPDCRQTKLWFTKPDPKKSKQILALGREQFGLITRWLTGHTYMARHQSLMHPEIDPKCFLCQEEDETPWHILTECPATYTLRMKLKPQEGWEVPEIMNLINKFRFLEVPEYNLSP